MHAIADTDRLVADGIITPEQSKIIQKRARETMVMLAINALLCFGIIAATGGLIFWLADALSVAIFGVLALGTGIFILRRAGEMYHMFGNASALIGAGMLLGGITVELLDKYEDAAGVVMLIIGIVVTGATGLAFLRGSAIARFVTGAILLAGVAMHLGGLGLLLEQADISGLPISLFYLYATVAVAGAGWLTDVRLVTALAIAPFAQALDTGTFYFHAAYVFYSPESTLSILQMAVLIVACLWFGKSLVERSARHTRILAILAFIVANLCALVGSLWGDVVGQSLWGPGASKRASGMSWEQYKTISDDFRETALVLSANLYSVLWAIALVVIILWAAQKHQRGLFNTALTFAGIHIYTQMFESFGDEPLAYVIGGLAAIPLAWGMWRLNQWLVAQES